MRFIYITIILSIVFVGIFAAPVALGAPGGLGNLDSFSTPGGSGNNGDPNSIQNPLRSSGTIYEFIAQVLKEVAKIGAVICVFFIIYSGFLFVTARGNPEKLTTAKSALAYTLIGAAILLGAGLLATIIENTIKNLRT